MTVEEIHHTSLLMVVVGRCKEATPLLSIGTLRSCDGLLDATDTGAGTALCNTWKKKQLIPVLDTNNKQKKQSGFSLEEARLWASWSMQNVGTTAATNNSSSNVISRFRKRMEGYGHFFDEEQV